MKMMAPMEVGLTVKDLPMMLDFYCTAFGMTVAADVSVPAPKAQEAALSAGAYRVVRLQTPWGERIKLLQEEIAANLNEQSNRTLFTLTVVTVLALPINIIAGFFGMNVGGVPLSGDPEGFWILVALVASFTLIAGRWAFRKRGDY